MAMMMRRRRTSLDTGKSRVIIVIFGHRVYVPARIRMCEVTLVSLCLPLRVLPS